MKTAVHFGAGNIGRGFLGQLYFESGYRTVFVDVVEEVVSALKTRHAYPIEIVGEESARIPVSNVDAVDGRDLEAVAAAVAMADIASTAVGVNALPHIVPGLAEGLRRRLEAETPPLNIIVCENLLHAGPFLRGKVLERLPEALHDALEARTGFVEASIGRMVPVMTPEQRAEDPLLVCVEAYCELPVDRDAFKGGIPEIAHLKPIANFGAYVERKLFVHNLSHAATAYLGHLRGHEFIWQAIRDNAVRERVEAATIESCNALALRRGLDRAALEEHRLDLIHRYHNRGLADQVERVARDPVRKLGREDRLVGGALQCLEAGITPQEIGFTVAAAMRYDSPTDPGARRVQALMAQGGVNAVLAEICQIGPESPLAELVRAGDARLLKDGWVRV
ncbi:MAG: mannitol dehydrogenase [Candidatus Hydrogenedens sp.]|nr:mannitol dehydrogenase [Candidatus Hydrogenedentota bacterium]NLF56261.1 mannitol dehydrogenase [Candidatus Hydrogenedens sp.]